MDDKDKKVKEGFSEKKLDEEIRSELLTSSKEQVSTMDNSLNQVKLNSNSTAFKTQKMQQLSPQGQSEIQLSQQIQDCKIIDKTREELNKMGYR